MKPKQKNRLLFMELSMTGVFHAGVNAGLVRVMREVYPEAEVVFHAERKHIKNLRPRLAGTEWRWKKFLFFPRTNKYTLLLRDLLACLYGMIRLLGSRKTDILFITNLLPLTHGCVYGLNTWLKRPMFICLHSQLEAFEEDTPLRKTRRYFRLHGPLFRKDRQTYYIILGNPIYDSVKHLFPPEAKTIVIDHPYDYSDTEDKNRLPLKYPLRFGQAGVGNRGKGTEKLFHLGELLREEIEAGKVELCLAGRLDPELRSHANRWVSWQVEPLSEEGFEKAVSGLHYMLFFRDGRCGRATPQGSFFDAVKYGKPFLSLDNAFVSHYLDRFPGCGAVFSSVEGMAGAIREICRTIPDDAYAGQVRSLRNMRQGVSAQAIAVSFKKQIGR